MRVLTISNQKGGVAKTTTAVSLSAALGEQGLRVLAVDMDPQANLTMGFGIEPENVVNGMFNVLIGERSGTKAILGRVAPGVDLIPADLTLAGAEKRLFGEIGFDEILRTRLQHLAARTDQALTDDERYDFAVVDCPPSLGLLTVNAITAANTVIVPVQCEYFSARGLGQLLEITDMVREKRNPSLTVRVLPTLYDRRNRICRDILEELRSSFAGEIFETAIGIDTRLRESSAAGRPIISYAPSSRAAEQYRQLASELSGRPCRKRPVRATKPKKAPRRRRHPAPGRSRA
ncbi:ParA family protein [Planctomycetota bacterium]